MIRLALFNLVLLLACGYALRRGGGPERWTGGMFLTAALATWAMTSLAGLLYVELEWRLLAIDIALLAGLLVVTARADRYWPMYVSAFHLLALATHGVRALDPAVLPAVYYRVAAWLAYPTLLLLAIATARHVRRVNAGLPEFDWTIQRHEQTDRQP